MYLTGFADEAGAAIATQVAATKELEWTNIELRNTGFEGDLATMSDEDFESLYAALREGGVAVNCFGSSISNWGKSIETPFEETLVDVRRCIPRLQRLKTPMVRIMSYAIIRDPDTWVPLPDELQMFEERCRRMNEFVPMFLDAGIQPVHENCMNYGGMCWKNTLRLLEAVPGLKLVFDTGNPPFSADMGAGVTTPPLPRQNTWEFYSHVKDCIEYVHIKDAKGEAADEPGNTFPKGQTFTYPGEGDGDVERVVADLLQSGYDGGFSIEPHLQVVFHEEGGETQEKAQYESYVEYGRRFEALLERIRAQGPASNAQRPTPNIQHPS